MQPDNGRIDGTRFSLWADEGWSWKSDFEVAWRTKDCGWNHSLLARAVAKSTISVDVDADYTSVSARQRASSAVSIVGSIRSPVDLIPVRSSSVRFARSGLISYRLVVLRDTILSCKTSFFSSSAEKQWVSLKVSAYAAIPLSISKSTCGRNINLTLTWIQH